MIPQSRAPFAGLAAVATLAVTAQALAQKAVSAQAPAGDRQPALVVGFDEKGLLRAQTCARSPCDLKGGTDLELPEDARAQASKARLSVMRIAKARRAITVDVDDTARGRGWFAVVAAPVDGTSAPKVLFRGWTGLVEGEWGLRHGPLVQRGGPNADGTWSLVIGEQREDLSLCGRPAILSPKLVSAGSHAQPAKVQRLLSGEREAAREVTATRLPATHRRRATSSCARSVPPAPSARRQPSPTATPARPGRKTAVPRGAASSC